jgi:hypothetical protein
LADQKLSALTADATPSSDDLVYTVNDPGGTPASRKVTIANLNAALDHGSLAGIADDDHTQYLLADGTRAATLLDVDNLRLDANTLSSTDANGDILLDPNGTGDVEVVSGNLLLANPLAVAEGGTGAATLTDGGVLLGSGTGAISATALGTSGQVLTSNGAGLDPTFQDAGAGSGDFVGPASATDNAVVRFDTTTGKLGQDSAIVIPDAVGSVAFLASKIGNALTVEVTEPAATTGASVAGNALTLNAGDAVASTDTAGAAAGGSVTIASGAAARNTSGNAKGGDINLTPAAGIGTGARGQVIVPLVNDATLPTFAFGDGDTGFYESSDDNLGLVTGGAIRAHWNSADTGAYTPLVAASNASGFRISTGTPSTVVPNFIPNRGDTDTGIGWAAADALSLVAGSVEIARLNEGQAGISNGLATFRCVEANTAGVGTPNALATTESRHLFTNEGVTAMNHHTLPAAAAGLEFMFYVQDADGITITAGAADTIRVAGSVSSAAGTAANSTIGGFIQLIAINATEWVAGATQGTWTLT